jgi:hypothetical protein
MQRNYPVRVMPSVSLQSSRVRHNSEVSVMIPGLLTGINVDLSRSVNRLSDKRRHGVLTTNVADDYHCTLSPALDPCGQRSEVGGYVPIMRRDFRARFPRAHAMACPMPPAAPVTRAVLP